MTSGERAGFRRATAFALALALLATLAVAPGQAQAAEPSAWRDYNDDGEKDLAIGIPGETIAGQAGAGAVQVLYGVSPGGFSATQQDFFSEGVLTTGDGPEPGDNFGATLASGDFDGDGFADLAIGSPGEDVESVPSSTDRGAVMILWGSEDGLAEDPAVARITGGGPGSNLGQALAALDMFHATSSDPAVVDGIADLAIGTRGNRVILEPGGSRDLMSSNLDRRLADVAGQPGYRMVFGRGDLDADAPDELIVGVPDTMTLNGAAAAGAFYVIERRADPQGVQANYFRQEDFGFTSRAGDNFGAAVVAGQLVGTDASFEELVVGAPGRDVSFNGASRNDAGVVYFFALGGAAVITQATTDAPDSPEGGDQFGASLAVAGFGGGGVHLAIGAPGEKIGTVDGAGAVIVRRGNNAGYQLLSQNTTGMPGTSAANDNFGATLAVGEYDGVGSADLAIGVPLDNEPNGVNNAGAVNVIYSNGTMLAPRTGDRLWTQATSGIPSAPGAADRFGAALR